MKELSPKTFRFDYDFIREPEQEPKSSPRRPARFSLTPMVLLQIISVSLLAVFIIVMIASGAESSTPFADVEASFDEVLDSGLLRKASSAQLKRFYSLNPADYANTLFYQAVSGNSAEEIVLVEMKDRSQLSETEAAFRNRISTRRSDFAGYAPAEEQIAENASILVKGRYACLIMSGDSGRYTDAFLGSL